MSAALLGLEWLRPAAAWAPLAGLLVLAAGAWGLARRRAERERLVHPAQLERFLPGFRPARARARVALAAAATAGLGLALIGPVKG